MTIVKSSLVMVGEMLRVTARSKAALSAGIRADVIRAMNSCDCIDSNAFGVFAFSVCLKQYLLLV